MLLRIAHRALGLLLLVLAFHPQAATAYQPPTQEMIEKYRRDGTLGERRARMRSTGNHRLSPKLLRAVQQRVSMGLMAAASSDDAEMQAAAASSIGGFPGIGTLRALVLLIEFKDAEHNAENTAEAIRTKLFGEGDASKLPYESMRNFYTRSSYGQLNIEGDVLDWYKFAENRADAPGVAEGLQEPMVREVLSYYDAAGYDFSRFDGDGDGKIDVIIVVWTGLDTGWGSFWWAYAAGFGSGDPVDGLLLSSFNWLPQTSAVNVFIHEMGHTLGLPDYYDYNNDVGPRGGLGGLDMMDGNKCDHNAFSKYLLAWITPTVVTAASTPLANVSLPAMGDAVVSGDAQAMILTLNTSQTTPFGEYFMVERRRQVGNDVCMSTDGLVVWHVDSTLNAAQNGFVYNNSDTSHKLLRLLEADGREQIENGGVADASDIYVPGTWLGPDTTPSTTFYTGTPSLFTVTNLAASTGAFTFDIYRDSTGPIGTPKAPSLPAGNIGLYGRLVFAWSQDGVYDLESGVVGANVQISSGVEQGNVYDGFLTGSSLVITPPLLHNQQVTARVRFRNGIGLYTAWSRNSAVITVKNPAITAISPKEGVVGDTVTLTGVGLKDAIEVLFSDTSTTASFVIVDDLHLTTTVPNDARTGPITVSLVEASATSNAQFRVGVQVTIDPAPRVLFSGRQARFVATVTGSDVASVQWSVTSGGISAFDDTSLVYVAGAPGAHAEITARSVADPTAEATVALRVPNLDFWPDDAIDVLDLAVLCRQWTGDGDNNDAAQLDPADLDGDGDIDDDDISLFLEVM